jgi:hypothetical protein
MTRVEVVCDRCRERITEGRLRLTVLAGDAPRGWPIDTATGAAAIDLCRPCTGELVKLVAEGAGKPAHP